MVLTIVIIVTLLVTNNIQEALAKGRDIERRTEINAMQSKLEEYWHANESYPADLSALLTLGIAPGTLSDPSGNPILVVPASSSSNQPSSSYTQTSTRPAQEYTYAPFNCPKANAEQTEESDTNEEATAEAPVALPEIATGCQSYVLYSWLEKAEADKIPFDAVNQHSAP